ncbi:MAG: FG-GAP repeat protein [Planctomycetota bacterium]
MSTRLQVAALFLLASPALAQAPLTGGSALPIPGATANERAGDALSFDGAHAVVGVPFRASTASQVGAAVVFPRTAGGFGTPTVLAPPTPSPNGMFGGDVALEGTELIVTERASLHFGLPVRGAFHRYRLVSGTWALIDSSASPTSTASSAFGASCDRDGDLLVVGAPFAVVSGGTRGAAYVYREVGGQGQVESMLAASDGQAGDRFGDSVAVSGERILIGGAWRMEGGQQVGAAYAFERIGGTWLETGRFAPDPSTADRAMGVAVDIDGTTAVIGAARTNARGATYVFVDGGAGWSLEQRLQPSNLGNFATFGDAVAVRGDALVVGAYQDTARGNLSGSAWVFERGGATWSAIVRLTTGMPSAAFFGQGVALDGAGAFLVGEPLRTPPGGASTAGAVYAFEPQRPFGTPYCAPVTHSGGRLGRLSALGSDVVANGEVTLVAYDLPFSAFGFFLTSRAQGSVPQPGGSQGVLCLGGSIGRYVGPGQVLNTANTGVLELELDLSATPQPTGLVSIVAGETWSFQTWFRDTIGGLSSSNFTEGLEIQFR